MLHGDEIITMINEKQLIDANDVYSLFDVNGLASLHITDIDVIPRVDAVEVVRCRDCLYSTERYGHLKCINGVSYRNTWNKPDFFCANGERKDSEENG